MRHMRWQMVTVVGVALVAFVLRWAVFSEPDLTDVPVPGLTDLERDLESMRARLDIPGMSAAIASGDTIIWAHGFGTANRERSIPAGAATMYHLASLTKPYGSTVVLQLVEEAKLGLDDPVSRFGVDVKRSTPVTVRHLLSHTSGDPPGTKYRYDGNAFGALTQIVERTTGRTFAREVTDRIIRRLS